MKPPKGLKLTKQVTTVTPSLRLTLRNQSSMGLNTARVGNQTGSSSIGRKSSRSSGDGKIKLRIQKPQNSHSRNNMVSCISSRKSSLGSQGGPCTASSVAKALAQKLEKPSQQPVRPPSVHNRVHTSQFKTMETAQKRSVLLQSRMQAPVQGLPPKSHRGTR